MKIDPRALIGPLLAVLILVVTVQQTQDSLRRAGLWIGVRRFGPARGSDPYSRLDQGIAHSGTAAPGTGMRDPFAYGGAPVTAAVKPHHVVKPKPAPLPVLTAIIWDIDPSALIRLEGHEYTLRTGGRFADYQVMSITRDRVTLMKDGQSLVLNRPLKGD